MGKKLALIIIIAIGSMVGCLVGQNKQQQSKVTEGLEETVTSFSEKSEKDIQYTLSDLSAETAEYIISLETAIDASMLNAAYYFQEVYDRNPKLTDKELRKMAVQTEMTDMLLCDRTGNFILSTDPKSLTLNLYDIWDGYKQLLTHPDLVLPSDLKISEESGSIYKYTAIPRRDGQGAIEAALNSDSIKQSVISYSQGTEGFESLVLVDSNNTVLIAIGETEKAAEYAEGSITKDPQFTQVFQEAKESIITGEKTSSIYYPVKKQDRVSYGLRLTIKKAPYFENVQVLSDKTTSLTKELKSSMSLGIASSATILIVLAAIMIIMIQQILRPIVHMAAAAKKIAEGSLNVEVKGKQGGEIGVLIKAFNGMTLDLKHMLTNVKKTSNIIKDSSATIRNSIEVVTNSSNEISNATEEISQGTYVLAEDNSQVFENTNELSNSLETMIRSMEGVNSNIGAMGEINKNGMKTLDNLEVHFHESINALNEVEGKIENLQEKSKSINLIVNTIGGISTQTNLLALNASIEAARAGEQGKGFAVVAEEVRKLAELSAKETKSIAEIIKEIILIVESTNTKMTSTKLAIAETNEALTGTKEIFCKLSNSTKEVDSNSKVITESIAYVSEAKNALLNLVENISAISQQSAASSKEVSESTVKQSRELAGVSEQIIKMDHIVGELNKLVNQYTLD
ncbi:MAG: methyl-accepting chemotaxis protein [Acetivibrio sp.]